MENVTLDSIYREFDRPALQSEDIEITPQMIEAGADAIVSLRDVVSPHGLASEVYIAMAALAAPSFQALTACVCGACAPSKDGA